MLLTSRMIEGVAIQTSLSLFQILDGCSDEDARYLIPMAGLLESSKQSSKNHQHLMDSQNHPPPRRRKHSSNEINFSEDWSLPSAPILELYIFIDLNHGDILSCFFSFVGSVPFGSSIYFMVTVCGALLSFWSQFSVHTYIWLLDSLNPAISDIFVGILSELVCSWRSDLKYLL